MANLPFLWPAPQTIKPFTGQFPIKDGLILYLVNTRPDDILFSVKRLKDQISQRHHVNWNIQIYQGSKNKAPAIYFQVISEIFKNPQSYRLIIRPDNISLTAMDPAGFFYGIITLIQIIQQNLEELPCLEIVDCPDYVTRGVMLDISRDRVPTMETLYYLVDRLADWKINQLQLYTEHTFAYSRHALVWENYSPMTAEEILLLDQYCRERFIELVPNQNSFGHMHRWLKHSNYAHLAEIHGKFESPWGPMEGPFSLSPILPESVEFLSGLYDELLPNFHSRLFNVGCDETVDLGKGKSKAACDEKGTGSVYLDFLLKIQNEVSKRNHVMQFWGDIILEHPGLISQLPDNAIALEWGYEETHPFDGHGRQFAESGIPFYVCPGTSAWNSIAGRTDNALNNLRLAAKCGLDNGALGYLITDWGDNGHWQQLPISFLGFLAGAGYSWAYQANKEGDIQRALNYFAFYDPTEAAGELVYVLGNLYKEIGITIHNASTLFQAMQTSLSAIKADLHLHEYRIDQVLATLQNSKLIFSRGKFLTKDGDKIADELLFTIRLLEHACKRIEYTDGKGKREELFTDIEDLVVEFERLWLMRSRRGGLEDSISRFSVIRDDYK